MIARKMTLTLKRYVFFMLLALTNLVSCQDNKDYYADDIEIFKNTPVWELAKAIDKHDLKEEEELLKKHPDWVDYQEPKFGITLLYWCVFNSPRKWDEYFYEEAKLLVEHGANPYLKDQENNFPLLKAADIHKGSKKFIELCLASKHTIELPDSSKRFFVNEALLEACGKLWEEVDAVKLLVDAGADINYFNADSTATPFSESITQENMNTARYLIIEKGAEYDVYVKRMVDRVDMSMLERLRNLDYSEEPEKQKIKEEILAYIKEQEIK